MLVCLCICYTLTIYINVYTLIIYTYVYTLIKIKQKYSKKFDTLELYGIFFPCKTYKMSYWVDVQYEPLFNLRISEIVNSYRSFSLWLRHPLLREAFPAPTQGVTGAFITCFPSVFTSRARTPTHSYLCPSPQRQLWGAGPCPPCPLLLARCLRHPGTRLHAGFRVRLGTRVFLWGGCRALHWPFLCRAVLEVFKCFPIQPRNLSSMTNFLFFQMIEYFCFLSPPRSWKLLRTDDFVWVLPSSALPSSSFSCKWTNILSG